MASRWGEPSSPTFSPTPEGWERRESRSKPGRFYMFCLRDPSQIRWINTGGTTRNNCVQHDRKRRRAAAAEDENPCADAVRQATLIVPASPEDKQHRPRQGSSSNSNAMRNYREICERKRQKQEDRERGCVPTLSSVSSVQADPTVSWPRRRATTGASIKRKHRSDKVSENESDGERVRKFREIGPAERAERDAAIRNARKLGAGQGPKPQTANGCKSALSTAPFGTMGGSLSDERLRPAAAVTRLPEKTVATNEARNNIPHSQQLERFAGVRGSIGSSQNALSAVYRERVSRALQQRSAIPHNCDELRQPGVGQSDDSTNGSTAPPTQPQGQERSSTVAAPASAASSTAASSFEAVLKRHCEQLADDAAGASTRSSADGVIIDGKNKGANQNEAGTSSFPQRKETKKRAQGKSADVVSENYVRLDLKRRYKMKRRHKITGRRGKNGGYINRPRDSKNDGGLSSKPQRVRRDRTEVGKLDFLEQCLDVVRSSDTGAVDATDDEATRRNAGSSASPSSFSSLQGGTTALQRPSTSVGDALAADSPRCPAHQRVSRLLTVKKSGPNKGRKFFACSLPRGEQCDFFMWEEDNPKHVLAALTSDDSERDWERRREQDWRNRLEKLRVSDMRRELQRRGLSSAGKRAELVSRLVACARIGLDDIDSDDLTESDFDELHAEAPQEMFESSRFVNFGSDSDIESDSGSDSDNHMAAGAVRHDDANARGVLADGGGGDEGEVGDNSRKRDVQRALKLFGHDQFRNGQRWAISRALGGESSLIVLPTGAGKSLCYQLPALLLPGITIVVSPLLALMADQMAHLPPQLAGACLNSTQNFRDTAQVVSDLRARRLKLLFVSPERFCSASFARMTCGGDPIMPPVSLVAVDEAHCLSEWSHNFRPCYLRLGSVIDDVLLRRGDGGPQRRVPVLALTATASPPVVEDICSCLSIDRQSGVLQTELRRRNLHLHAAPVASEDDKYIALERLLSAPPFSGSGNTSKRGASVIVYVPYTFQADAIASNLKSQGFAAAAYHARLCASERAKVQQHFMRDRVRVIVATVAFGMGLDKSNVRGVVHFACPKSMENYIQEVGRAGRDGAPALCHVMLSQEDAQRSHSLTHSDGIDMLQVLSFLHYLFFCHRDVDGRDIDGAQLSPLFECALRLGHLSDMFDLREEVVETMLTTLALPPLNMLRLHGSMKDGVTVTFRQSGKRHPTALAKSDSLIKAVLEVGIEGSSSSSDGPNSRGSAMGANGYGLPTFKFSLVGLARHLGGADTGEILRKLSRMQSDGDLVYRLGDFAFHVAVIQRPSLAGDEDGQHCCRLEEVARTLYEKMERMERAAAQKVSTVYGAIISAVKADQAARDGDVTTDNCVDLADAPYRQCRHTSPRLSEHVAEYFNLQCADDDSRDSGHDAGGKGCSFVESPALIPSEKDTRRIYSDAQVLMLDPALTQEVRGCAQYAEMSSNGESEDGCDRPIVSLADVCSVATASQTSPRELLAAINARVLARILHGIGSPLYPTGEWREHPLWGRHRKFDFNKLLAVVGAAVNA